MLEFGKFWPFEPIALCFSHAPWGFWAIRLAPPLTVIRSLVQNPCVIQHPCSVPMWFGITTWARKTPLQVYELLNVCPERESGENIPSLLCNYSTLCKVGYHGSICMYDHLSFMSLSLSLYLLHPRLHACMSPHDFISTGPSTSKSWSSASSSSWSGWNAANPSHLLQKYPVTNACPSLNAPLRWTSPSKDTHGCR